MFIYFFKTFKHVKIITASSVETESIKMKFLNMKNCSLNQEHF